MAAIQNARDVQLAAAPARVLPVTLPPTTVVPPGNLGPGQLPGTVTGADGSQIVSTNVLKASTILVDQIRDTSGNLMFQANKLAASSVAGLGALALKSSVLATDVQGLGSLALKNAVAAGDVAGLGALATKSTVYASELGVGTLAVGVQYAGTVFAEQIDARGLAIKDAAGNVILSAGVPLAAGRITGLGALATRNDVTAGMVTGLGSVALKNVLSTADVSGLGSLATLNAVTAAMVGGLGPLATRSDVAASMVTGLGALALKSTVYASELGAGTFAAGVIYAGEVLAEKIRGGDFTGKTFTGGEFNGSTFNGARFMGQVANIDKAEVTGYIDVKGDLITRGAANLSSVTLDSSIYGPGALATFKNIIVNTDAKVFNLEVNGAVTGTLPVTGTVRCNSLGADWDIRGMNLYASGPTSLGGTLAVAGQVSGDGFNDFVRAGASRKRVCRITDQGVTRSVVIEFGDIAV